MHVPPSPQVWQLPQLRINSPEMEHDSPRGLRFRALFTNTLKRASEEKQKVEEVASRNLTSRLFPQTLFTNLTIKLPSLIRPAISVGNYSETNNIEINKKPISHCS